MTIVLADLILIGLVVFNIGLLYKTWSNSHRLRGLELLVIAFTEFMEGAE